MVFTEISRRPISDDNDIDRVFYLMPGVREILRVSSDLVKPRPSRTLLLSFIYPVTDLNDILSP